MTPVILPSANADLEDGFWFLSRRFPYGVYYSVDGKTAVVKAVLDCRRDPKWIRRRLR